MSRTITTINPATGESLKTYDAAGLDNILAILEAVHNASLRHTAKRIIIAQTTHVG